MEGGAVVGIEAGLKIKWGEDEFADDVFFQVGNDGFFEISENTVGVTLFFLFPVDLVAG